MPSKWIAALLSRMEKDLDPGLAKQLIKASSSSHYDHLGMDQVLAPYVGNLDAFTAFLTRAWGWRIHHDRKAGVVLIDENKDHCVCPLRHKEGGLDSGMLCACSEGMAERMFSTVVGRPVRAEVVASILRGAERCVYRITL